MKKIKAKYKIHLETKENGIEIQIQGNTPSVLTALTTFVDTLREYGFSKDSIQHAVDLAFLSDEELKTSLNKKREELDKILKEFFS